MPDVKSATGLTYATVDREQGRAEVVYDPARTNPAAIAEAGFQAQVSL